MCENGKLILGIIIGIVTTILAAFLTVAIASLFNDVSMPQQIVNWFGNNTSGITYTVEQVVETAASIG